ncbi:MAG: helix-turn-helix domain-containing protein [Lachnospiraceae bacterium]|nr:helix-turn-helix domain-containing protein [Lachnospiraceae bacterium]
MQIYERVFGLLQDMGMTQKEFSEKTGIPQSTISDWKNKKVNPSSDKIMIICQVLGVTPYDILSGTESDKYEKPDYLIVNKSTEEYILIDSIRKLSKSKYNRLFGYVEALSVTEE